MMSLYSLGQSGSNRRSSWVKELLCLEINLFSTFLANVHVARAKRFGEVRGPVRPFIFNLEVGWLHTIKFLKGQRSLHVLSCHLNTKPALGPIGEKRTTWKSK